MENLSSNPKSIKASFPWQPDFCSNNICPTQATFVILTIVLINNCDSNTFSREFCACNNCLKNSSGNFFLDKIKCNAHCWNSNISINNCSNNTCSNNNWPNVDRTNVVKTQSMLQQLLLQQILLEQIFVRTKFLHPLSSKAFRKKMSKNLFYVNSIFREMDCAIKLFLYSGYTNLYLIAIVFSSRKQF